MRRIVVLAAMAVVLGFAPVARAQLKLDWVETPPPGDELTKRLEDQAASMARVSSFDPSAHPHTVAFDYVYPVEAGEYRALGGEGVLLVAVIAKDLKELPVKRVVLRFGLKEIVLQPIAFRQSTIPPTSPLAHDIGINREDAFFLLPSVLPGKTADLVVVFATPGQQFLAGRLSLAPPDVLDAFPKPPVGPPDPAMLGAVLAREYPNMIKP